LFFFMLSYKGIFIDLFLFFSFYILLHNIPKDVPWVDFIK